ncbi:MAG: prephenate dehydrogenase/arogenate dehydrogenase family protein [Nitrospirota bacterium]|nr:prephenate dehydrogenase/arogenate dehydrogenase family protein [Nitrospirota bacterium]NOY84750.1 prephenate dehydrogenase/arogenate dehydrogenase family protein [Candidatus Manganitrophaceae bacterium]
MLFKQITIIGVGLIGGSLGLALKKKKNIKTIVGYGRRRGALHKAVTINAIDRYCLTLSKAVKDAELVLLATPVGTFESLCRLIGPHLQPGTIVTDAGSVKGDFVEKLSALLPEDVHFVGGHPIAGREKSGIMAATGVLYKGCRVILTPNIKTNRDALCKVAALWTSVGANVSEADPYDHDRILSFVSHLPHVVAYALMETLMHPCISGLSPVEYSAGGLRDFTRIAASSPEMWRDIFLSNKKSIIESIDTYQETIETIKKKILSDDGEGLVEIFKRANDIREQATQ